MELSDEIKTAATKGKAADLHRLLVAGGCNINAVDLVMIPALIIVYLNNEIFSCLYLCKYMYMNLIVYN